jgi:hypothetical protein
MSLIPEPGTEVSEQTVEAVLQGRHPSTLEWMRWLRPNPKLPREAATISQGCWLLALSMCNSLPDGVQLSSGLHALVEAKDCFVRASLPEADRG